MVSELLKPFWKQWEKRESNTTKLFFLARSKFNSIEKIISKAFSYAKISHKETLLIIDEAENYSELKNVLEWCISKNIYIERKNW